MVWTIGASKTPSVHSGERKGTFALCATNSCVELVGSNINPPVLKLGIRHVTCTDMCVCSNVNCQLLLVILKHAVIEYVLITIVIN